jgi:hypothetical protein
MLKRYYSVIGNDDDWNYINEKQSRAQLNIKEIIFLRGKVNEIEELSKAIKLEIEKTGETINLLTLDMVEISKKVIFIKQLIDCLSWLSHYKKPA